MIKLRSFGAVPGSYYDQRVHCLSVKNTLYAFHNEDIYHSKTNIISFSDHSTAENFRSVLAKLQTKGKTIERCLSMVESQAYVIDYPMRNIPIQIVDYNITDLMKTCHLNFFNMYVIFDIHNSSDEVISLKYFEYNSVDIPNRGYMNFYLNLMMHSS
jgi:hypothetical protein